MTHNITMKFIINYQRNKVSQYLHLNNATVHHAQKTNTKMTFVK